MNQEDLKLNEKKTIPANPMMTQVSELSEIVLKQRS